MTGITAVLSVLVLCSADNALPTRNLISSITAFDSEGQRTLRRKDRSYINPLYVGGGIAATILVVSVPILVFFYWDDMFGDKGTTTKAAPSVKKNAPVESTQGSASIPESSPDTPSLISVNVTEPFFPFSLTEDRSPDFECDQKDVEKFCGTFQVCGGDNKCHPACTSATDCLGHQICSDGFCQVVASRPVSSPVTTTAPVNSSQVTKTAPVESSQVTEVTTTAPVNSSQAPPPTAPAAVTGMDGTAEACFLHNTVYNVLPDKGTKETQKDDIETAKACNELCVGAKEECNFWIFLGSSMKCFLLGNNGEKLDTYSHGGFISGPKGSKNCDLTTVVVSTATPTTTAIPVVSTEFTGDETTTKAPPSAIITDGGVVSGQPCVFPFTYQGTAYNSCTLVGTPEAGRSWCATETIVGIVNTGKWGYCPDVTITAFMEY